MYRIYLMVLLTLAMPAWAAAEDMDGEFALRPREVSRKQAMGLSAVFPGLGQLATGHRQRGTAMVVAEVGFIVVWLTSHADYNTQKEQFDAERVRYSAWAEGGSFAGADASWLRLQQKKNDLDGSHSRRVLFGALSGALYGYGLLDALLWEGGRMVKEEGVGLAPRPTGLAVVYRF